MGIRFLCPNGHRLNVKAELAGKRGSCPECGAKLTIPAATASQTETLQTATVVEAAPASAAWHVRSAAGDQVGPLSELQFRAWIAGGRVTADSLVWREGWPEWKPARTVAELLPTPLVATPIAAAPTTATFAPRAGESVVACPTPGPAEPAAESADTSPNVDEEVDDKIILESSDAGASSSAALATSTYVYRRQRIKRMQLTLAIAMLLAVVVLAGVLFWVVNLNSSTTNDNMSQSPASHAFSPTVKQ